MPIKSCCLLLPSLLLALSPLAYRLSAQTPDGKPPVVSHDKSRVLTIDSGRVTIPVPKGYAFDDNPVLHDNMQAMADQTTKEKIYAIFETESDQIHAQTDQRQQHAIYSVKTYAGSSNLTVTPEIFENNVESSVISNWESIWKRKPSTQNREKTVDTKHSGPMTVKLPDKLQDLYIISRTSSSIIMAGIVNGIEYHSIAGVQTYNQFDSVAFLRINDKVIRVAEIAPLKDEADIQKATNAMHDWVTDILKANSPSGTIIHEYLLPTPPP